MSTVGFPLVGGPAGTMEGGRQAEVAQEILSGKNVPYIVAAPLLIQDLHSWNENGVAGLQSVVRVAMCQSCTYLLCMCMQQWQQTAGCCSTAGCTHSLVEFYIILWVFALLAR